MPGAAPIRGRRGTQLLLGWHSRFRSVNAYTGQPGLFSSTKQAADLAGLVVGKLGNSVRAGHGMPRWDQSVSAGGIARLTLESSVAGQDVEDLRWDFPQYVMSLSIFARVYPLTAPGANLAGSPWVITLGTGTEQPGGYLGIRHLGTAWQAIRLRGAGPASIDSNFVEPGGTVYPIDLLATFSADVGNAGTVQLFTRDALGVLRQGAAASGAGFGTVTELWSGQQVVLGSGGRYWFEAVKVARGIRTLTQMDALA